MQPPESFSHLPHEDEEMQLQIEHSVAEEKLIEGCRKGRALAQKQLYERFSPHMLGVCLRYISDRPEAEEVMIGGFMRVFNKIDQYQGKGSFEGWIRRIMVNESLTYLRKNRYMYLEVDIEQARGTFNYEEADMQLKAEELLELVRQLPVGYRTVFNLYAIEGYSHDEIAEKLAISTSTSKSQLSRARKLLQQHLAKHDKMSNPKSGSYE